MADATPTGIGKTKDKEEKKPVQEKPVVETPKAKQKVTLPDGTVIETF